MIANICILAICQAHDHICTMLGILWELSTHSLSLCPPSLITFRWSRWHSPACFSDGAEVSDRLVLCSQKLSCRIEIWVLVCLNLRCMILMISCTISSLACISYPTSSKTFILVEVMFFGGDLHTSSPLHPGVGCPGLNDTKENHPSLAGWNWPKE